MPRAPQRSQFLAPRTTARAATLVIRLVTVLTWCGMFAGALPGCAGRGPAAAGDDGQRLSNATRLWAQGDSLKSEGKFADAAAQYRLALEQRDDLGAVWNNLGVCQMESASLQDALASFHRAGELLPADPRPMENIGQVYLRSYSADKASEYFLRALERDPNHLPALRGYAKSVRALSRSDERSAEHLRRALLLEKDPAWIRTFELERLRVEQDLAERARPRG